MNKIYTAKIAENTVRFTRIGCDVDAFVSQDDMRGVLEKCCTGDVLPVFGLMLDLAIRQFTDSQDRRGAVVATETIGPVINVYAMGNILTVLSDFKNVEPQGLRLSGQQFHSLLEEFTAAAGVAVIELGLSLNDLVVSANARLDRHFPSLVVEVTNDSGTWVAECDSLGLVTEADSFDHLKERVWEIAPDLAHDNLPDLDPGLMRLQFRQIETACEHRLAN